VSYVLLTASAPRLPGFVADAALSRRDSYRAPIRSAAGNQALLLPQLEYTHCTCPCCVTRPCGWLGLSVCVECCDAPAAAVTVRGS
jgi:hypothetical protein